MRDRFVAGPAALLGGVMMLGMSPMRAEAQRLMPAPSAVLTSRAYTPSQVLARVRALPNGALLLQQAHVTGTSVGSSATLAFGQANTVRFGGMQASVNAKAVDVTTNADGSLTVALQPRGSGNESEVTLTLASRVPQPSSPQTYLVVFGLVSGQPLAAKNNAHVAIQPPAGSAVPAANATCPGDMLQASRDANGVLTCAVTALVDVAQPNLTTEIRLTFDYFGRNIEVVDVSLLRVH